MNANSHEKHSEVFNSLFSDLSATDVAKIKLKHKLASKILKMRNQGNMSQTQLADYMSVSQGMVARWESGNCNFTIDTLIDVFDKFEINIDITFSDDNASFCNPSYEIQQCSSYVKRGSGYAFSNNLLPNAG